MFDVVIIGGGFAGIATAFRLAGRARRILVLERDPAPGQRAPARHAGIIRTFLADEAIQDLALQSAAWLAGAAGDPESAPVFRRTGGFVLDGGGAREGSGRSTARIRAAGRAVHEGTGIPEPARGYLPSPNGKEVRWFGVPEDGVADIHALLSTYLAGARARGVEIRCGTEVLEVLSQDGRVAGVRTRHGTVSAGVVVNAAGAWAGELPGAGIGPRLELVSLRRHLFTTGPVATVDPDLPWIWHDGSGYYFRPESGGLLLSGCDETLSPPGDPAVDPVEEERLAAKLLVHAPALAEFPVRNRWACLRTFAPDRRFVIGWDPDLEGLFWVTALGGHGVTVSAAVGSLAAEAILAGPSVSANSPFSPGRFGHRASRTG